MSNHVSVYFVDGTGPLCIDCAIEAVSDFLIENGWSFSEAQDIQDLIVEFALAMIDGSIVLRDCQIDDVPHTDLDDDVTHCIVCEWDFTSDCLECQKEASDEIVP